MRFAVFEVSGAEPGTLDWPVRFLRPQIGVVTAIKRDHYSAFRSLEAIAAEKSKLISCLPRKGIAVLNYDDPLVRAMAEVAPGQVLWVGRSTEVDVQLIEAASNWPEPLTVVVRYKGEEFTARTRLHGVHLALPVVSAVGVALAAGVPISEAMEELADAPPTTGRMQIIHDGHGVSFVRDDWKSPQWALSDVFEFMQSARAKRKICVIGTISDSPDPPKRRYRRAAEAAIQVAEVAIFVGRDANHALGASRPSTHKRVIAFETVREAAEFLEEELRSGDLVLLKGSTKNDHLARVALNRVSRVKCWREGCRRNIMCERCSMLR